MNHTVTIDQLMTQRAYIMRELKAGRMKFKLAMLVRRDLDKKILKAQRELRK